MKLSTIFAVIVLVLGHQMTTEHTSKYLNRLFFRMTIALIFNISDLQQKSLRILKMKLKLCNSIVCNKCRKIVYENASQNHVQRCKRVLDFEDCCDQTKSYSDSFFG